MTRNDLPYVILVTIFGAAIFMAGRMSAPTVTVAAPVVAAPAIPSAPQVIVITTASAEPKQAPAPVAVLAPVPSVSAAPVATVKHPVIKAPEAKPESPKPVPSIHVELEDEPVNPYRSGKP